MISRLIVLSFLILIAMAAVATPALCAFDPRYNEPKPVKRVALVIGNADYAHADKLPGSLTDAHTIADRLRDAEFEVTLGENVRTREEFLNHYFFPFLDKISPGAFVVFYFSGHGFSYGPDSYLTPLEFPEKILSEEVPTTFLAAASLQERINSQKPALLLMLLDACRNIGGFIIEPSPGASGTVEKGLASLASAQNNIIGFASEPGAVSLGSASGDLSKYTAALAEFMTKQDTEFDVAYRYIVAKVRAMTRNRQSPWVSSSRTLEVYFSPSDAIKEQYKQLWLAAQQSDDAGQVQNYLDLFGLSAYAADARLWLSERGSRTRSVARVSPSEIEAQWQSAKVDIATAPKISGPLALPRVAKQLIASARAVDLKSVADVLASAQTVVVDQGVAARTAPKVSAAIARSLSPGEKVDVDAIERDSSGGSWLRGTVTDSADTIYIEVPKNAAVTEATLGSALVEFELEPTPFGTAAFGDLDQIVGELEKLKKAGAQITWVSIATPARPKSGERSARDAAMLKMRATYGAYIIGMNLPPQRITIVEGAEFFGDNPRVRIFGKPSGK